MFDTTQVPKITEVVEQLRSKVPSNLLVHGGIESVAASGTFSVSGDSGTSGYFEHFWALSSAGVQEFRSS
eukprot:8048432-Alexandrium_andersonii.AAC.1